MNDVVYCSAPICDCMRDYDDERKKLRLIERPIGPSVVMERKEKVIIIKTTTCDKKGNLSLVVLEVATDSCTDILLEESIV